MIMDIAINGRVIGPEHPPYIVAEMSANHNKDFSRAMEIIKAAQEAGADAVKLQTYTPDTITIDCDNKYFRIKGTPWQGKKLYELYEEAYTPWDWQPELMRVANDLGLDFFSTPFDGSAVDFLEKMKVPAYKVASFEIVDIPLLRKIARTGKPIILSTGMATLDEIRESVETVMDEGNQKIALLRCVSAYPAPPDEMNLRTIPHLAETFGVPVGISDHTLGSAVAIAAVSLGACIVEKHLTLSRSDSGPDSAFSLEPSEFKEMVKEVRTAEKAIGKVCYDVTDGQRPSLVFRRSLFVVKDVKAGEPFTKANVRAIRPGHGLHTRELERVLGKRAKVDIRMGTPLSWKLIRQ
jgi:pseudaminic acid synthase